MTDQQFLMWIHERLLHVHKENELMDYMHKLRAIIANMSPTKTTPNVGTCDNTCEALRKALWPDREGPNARIQGQAESGEAACSASPGMKS